MDVYYLNLKIFCQLILIYIYVLINIVYQYNYIIYLSENIDGLKNGNYIGYINFILDYETTETNVKYMDIMEPYKGNGLSIYLFLLFCELSCYNGIDTITLDDMSERPWDKTNVYVKLGMEYLVYNEPEMVGYACIIKKNGIEVIFYLNLFLTSMV